MWLLLLAVAAARAEEIGLQPSGHFNLTAQICPERCSKRCLDFGSGCSLKIPAPGDFALGPYDAHRACVQKSKQPRPKKTQIVSGYQDLGRDGALVVKAVNWNWLKLEPDLPLRFL